MGIYQVAPHAGAWIEIAHLLNEDKNYEVAPHAGAWIEILYHLHGILGVVSHPMRVRGLK